MNVQVEPLPVREDDRPDERHYPRLLYCSAVAPLASNAGLLLIFRHLYVWPSRRLMVVVPEQTGFSRELQPAVSVSVVPPPKWMRPMRRHMFWSAAETLIGSRIKAAFAAQADRFRPDAVCSTMLPDWFLTAAASYARERSLPLVLLCHDDYSDTLPASGRRQQANLYRQAAARLCVSAVMEQEYFRRYGVHGTVLPPIPSAAARAPQPQTQEAPLVIGFAGLIGSGYVDAILRLADALQKVGGRFVMASQNLEWPPANAILQHPAIEYLGHLKPDEVSPRLTAAGVNVLCVVQSFAPGDQRAFRFNFPSKLSEYATFGLPILIVAPAEGSASLWLKDRPGVALAVDELRPEKFTAAIERLGKADTRRKLAEEFRAAAAEFDPDELHRQFAATIADVARC